METLLPDAERGIDVITEVNSVVCLTRALADCGKNWSRLLNWAIYSSNSAAQVITS